MTTIMRRSYNGKELRENATWKYDLYAVASVLHPYWSYLVRRSGVVDNAHVEITKRSSNRNLYPGESIQSLPRFMRHDVLKCFPIIFVRFQVYHLLSNTMFCTIQYNVVQLSRVFTKCMKTWREKCIYIENIICILRTRYHYVRCHSAGPEGPLLPRVTSSAISVKRSVGQVVRVRL